MIADHLLGDQLKRDQINFAYQVLFKVFETPAKEKLLRKDESMLKTSIPMLIAFKTLEKMIIVDDLRKENEDMIEERKSQIRKSTTMKDSQLLKSTLSKSSFMKIQSNQGINEDYAKLEEEDFENQLVDLYGVSVKIKLAILVLGKLRR